MPNLGQRKTRIGYYYWVVDEYADRIAKVDRRVMEGRLAEMRPGAKVPWMFEDEGKAEEFMVARARQRMVEAKHEWQRARQRLWKLEKKFKGKTVVVAQVDPVENVSVENEAKAVESAKPAENTMGINTHAPVEINPVEKSNG